MARHAEEVLRSLCSFGMRYLFKFVLIQMKKSLYDLSVHFLVTAQQIAIILINMNKRLDEKSGTSSLENYYYALFQDYFAYFGFSTLTVILLQV